MRAVHGRPDQEERRKKEAAPAPVVEVAAPAEEVAAVAEATEAAPEAEKHPLQHLQLLPAPKAATGWRNYCGSSDAR